MQIPTESKEPKIVMITESLTKRTKEKKKFMVQKKCSTQSDESNSTFLGGKLVRNEETQQRRSKHDLKGRDYLCSQCWKSYLSYAAMYVHLKKKHNITIMNLKTSYIKRNKVSSIDLLAKVRLKKHFRNFEEKFALYFELIFNDVFIENIDKYSQFYSNIYLLDYKSHPLFQQIINMHEIFKSKTVLEYFKTNSEIIKNLDNAISLYIFGYWHFNCKEENLMNLRIGLLFREFLNFIGWDHLSLLANYNIIDSSGANNTFEYSTQMLAENLPELLDDFLAIFLKNGAPSFEKSYSEVKHFLTEFCNLLHNEGVINYILEPID